MHFRKIPVCLVSFSLLSLFLSISCNDSNPVSAGSGDARFGYVEGYVTLNGKPADNVIVYSTTAAVGTDSTLLLKQKASLQLNSDSIGYYRMSLSAGTYILVFYQSNIYNSNVACKKRVEIIAGSTVNLNVELNDQQFALAAYSLGSRVVKLNWSSFAESYRIYRSNDSIAWSEITPTSYDYSYSSINDTVPSYGTYYYYVKGFNHDTLHSQTSIKKIVVDNKPPTIQNASVSDSLTFLYCSGSFRNTSEYEGHVGVVVLRKKGATQTYLPIDTVEPIVNPYSSYEKAYLFQFKDSTCDTGYYNFKFYSLDLNSNKHGDTTSSYPLHYTKTTPSPTVYVTDSLLFVDISVQLNYSLKTSEMVIIYRSTDDSSHFSVLDTIFSNSNNSYYSCRYKDYSVKTDTFYYAAKVVNGTTGLGSSRSRAVRIIHTGAPAAPSIRSVVDSGLYVKITYYPTSNNFPIVLFRAHNGDTTNLDTITSMYDPYTNYDYSYRDYPSEAGRYSYAIAHLGLNNEIGTRSEWSSTEFTNAPKQPTLTLSVSNGYMVCQIGISPNISGVILKRSFNTLNNIEKVDTIYTNQNIDYYYNSIKHTDTLTQRGAYFYSAQTFDLQKRYSKETTASYYFSGELPVPSSPTLTSYNTTITVSFSSVSYNTYDSIFVFRAKDSIANFAKVAALSGYYSSFNDSVYTLGSGTYYYKIKVKKGALYSDFSSPSVIYYSGNLTSPSNITLRADSNSVRISLPNYSYPIDSLVLYRSFNNGTFVQVASFKKPVTTMMYIDTVSLMGNYSYKTKAFYGKLTSSFSNAVLIAVPGTGYTTITFPSKSTILNVGSSTYIQWDKSMFTYSTISLSLYKGDIYVSSIISSVSASTQSLIWVVPGSLTPGKDYRIRMTDYYSGTMVDYSSYFTIQ